ncbi:MAG: hypothetical protein CM15mP22_6420 [Gammaproteobacteria bacterium]|nr:MAG: hypothetical protein CM15mP22_6420 [Gammaproteobacteria bacterium]
MKFDIVGVGKKLVDETFLLWDKQFFDSTDFFFNQFKAITFEEQEQFFSNLPPNQIPKIFVEDQQLIVLGAAKIRVSLNVLISAVWKDERGKQYEQDLEKKFNLRCK